MPADYNNLTEVEWSWLACAVDGEGNIGVFRSKRYNIIVGYQLRTRICNTSIKFIEKAAFLMDEDIMTTKREPPRKDLYWLQIADLCKNIWFLEGMLPYLTVKRKFAEMGIEFCNSRLSSHKGDGYSDREIEICSKIKARGGG